MRNPSAVLKKIGCVLENQGVIDPWRGFSRNSAMWAEWFVGGSFCRNSPGTIAHTLAKSHFGILFNAIKAAFLAKKYPFQVFTSLVQVTSHP
jgi:hypothetical protein